jgi:hypothetical protein
MAHGVAIAADVRVRLGAFSQAARQQRDRPRRRIAGPGEVELGAIACRDRECLTRARLALQLA